MKDIHKDGTSVFVQMIGRPPCHEGARWDYFPCDRIDRPQPCQAEITTCAVYRGEVIYWVKGEIFTPEG